MSYIFDFSPFGNTLINLGIIESFNPEETIIEIGDKSDFARLKEEGKIKFCTRPARVTYEDGINIYSGFLYIRDYAIERYNTFPKAHITNCRNINEKPGRYIFSSKRTVFVYDRETNKQYHDLELNICKNCIKDLSEITPDTSLKLIESLIQSGHKVEQDVGLDGYTKTWPIISRNYKNSKLYICEKCGINLSSFKKFCHVHHIDHNKVNNNPSNLNCLCILCHASVDRLHISNYQSQRKEIDSFIKNNKDYLKNHNPYLKLWITKS